MTMLEGIRVLDFSTLYPGPVCSMHLADLGAEVVKIENPKGGDYAKTLSYPQTNGVSTLYRMLNHKKQIKEIDLKDTEGQEKVLELVSNTDVLIEGFRPGVMDKFGLGYEAVKKLNPGIIYCSITGFGQTGPYSSKAGHDINFAALSGVLYHPTQGAVLPNFQLGDLIGGALQALSSILAALVKKGRTSEGSYIDVSMLDGLLAHSVSAFSTNKAPDWFPRGMLCGQMPCYGLYKTKDERYLAVGALEAKFWKQFCEVIDAEELTSKGMSMGPEAEKTQNAVQAILKQKNLAEWAEVFEKEDCCVTPVLKPEEVEKNQQIAARNMIQQEGELELFRTMFRFGKD